MDMLVFKCDLLINMLVLISIYLQCELSFSIYSDASMFPILW
jgi:hypothetical protein